MKGEVLLGAAALCPGLRLEVQERPSGETPLGVVRALPLQTPPGSPSRWLAVRRDARVDEPMAAGSVSQESSLCDLLSRWLAPRPAEQRNAVVSFLAGVSGEQVADPSRLSTVLHLVRQALRERLPPRGTDKVSGPRWVAVHQLHDRHFHLLGRSSMPRAVLNLVAVSPEGHRVDLPAPEGEDFAHCCRLESPSRRPQGWLVEGWEGDGAVFEQAAAAVTVDPIEVMEPLLRQWRSPVGSPCARDGESLRQELRRRLWAGARVVIDREFGDVPRNPSASVVVPILDNVAEAEQFLAASAGTRRVGETEILYVLDGGRPTERALPDLLDLHALYGVPFRVLVPDRRVDVELAVSLGSGCARGPVCPLPAEGLLPSGLSGGQWVAGVGTTVADARGWITSRTPSAQGDA